MKQKFDTFFTLMLFQILTHQLYSYAKTGLCKISNFLSAKLIYLLIMPIGLGPHVDVINSNNDTHKWGKVNYYSRKYIFWNPDS